ncbi:hypothetical protein BKA63DRAFT_251943 [Paraphoma chrysanthemicola]|nr:hypothetical protein BKA63DRAFT_251943 [Paraphoma chrysanthemicola]
MADISLAFDPSTYYTIRNVADLNFGLSSGQNMGPQGLVDLQAAGSLSSENWQILYQAGRYFIRNRDYGAGWQLGLTTGNISQPQLYPLSTGGKNLQWTITKVDLGWQLENGLLGAGPVMVLNPTGALPLMQLGGTNGIWNITSNPSASKDKPLTGVWTSSVQSFETPTPTPSSSLSLPISTQTTISSAATTTVLPPSTTPNSNTNAITPSSSSSSSLATGAIVGIVIGALALIIGAVLAVYFLVIKKKRKQRRQHGNPYEVHEDTAPPLTEKYAHRAELASPPVELASTDRDTVWNRAELSSEPNHGAK